MAQSSGFHRDASPFFQSPTSSYTYEATFGLGSIGMNLQSTRSGIGCYCDSFRRNDDGTLLPAEMSGYIKLGDVLLEINGEDVSQTALADIPRVLERTKRPMTIKFERVIMALQFEDVARDPRKLPWLMQFLVDTYGVEGGVVDQTKLLLWLECDQYIQNVKILSDADVHMHGLAIMRKFFLAASRFSLLSEQSLSDKVRKRLDAVLADCQGGTPVVEASPLHHTPEISARNTKYHRLFRECLVWTEADLAGRPEGPFQAFMGAAAASRMMGYLVYSPPFEKMTLFDILKCDRRTMYMLAFLSHTKRHPTLYCYRVLKGLNLLDFYVSSYSSAGLRPEELKELLRVGYLCAHVLGLDDGQQSAEDRTMVRRLRDLVRIADASDIFHISKDVMSGYFGMHFETRDVMSPILELDILSSPVKSLRLEGAGPACGLEPATPYYTNQATGAFAHTPAGLPSFSSPRPGTADPTSARELGEALVSCLVQLRNTVLRELVQDLCPKFIESAEFEILLWELNEYYEQQQRIKAEEANNSPTSRDDSRQHRIASRDSVTDDEELRSLDSNGNDSDSSGGARGGVVPDGAVQRLLRKVTLPKHMTMHRAPLDALETIPTGHREAQYTDPSVLHHEPLAWLVRFDTTFLAPSNGGAASAARKVKPRLQVSPSVAIPFDAAHGLPPAEHKSDNSKLIEQVIAGSISDFVVPSGKIVWQSSGTHAFDNQIPSSQQPTPKLFNFVISSGGPDSQLLYSAALTCFRGLRAEEDALWDEQFRLASTPSSTSGSPPAAVATPGPANSGTPSVPYTPGDLRTSGPTISSASVGLTPMTAQKPAGVPNTAFEPRGGSPRESALRAIPENAVPTLDTSGGAAAGYNWKEGLDMFKGKTMPLLEKFKGITPQSFLNKGSQSATAEQSGPGADQERADVGNAPTAPTESEVAGGGMSKLALLEAFDSEPRDGESGAMLPPLPPRTEETRTNSTASTSDISNTTSDSSGARSATPERASTPPLSAAVDRTPYPRPIGTVNSTYMTPAPYTSMTTRYRAPEYDRMAIFGYCIVSTVPCVDALRLPLFLANRSIDLTSPGEADAASRCTPATPITPQMPPGHDHTPVASSAHGTGVEELAQALSTQSAFDGVRAAALRVDTSLPSMFRWGGASDCVFDHVVENVNSRNLVALFFAFMLEHKVAVISSKLSSLTSLGEFMREAIAPFRWNHVYVPVLPKKMSAQILECPTPFFVGIHREFFDSRSVPVDVCILDLDHNACRMSADLTKALKAGRRLIRAIDNILRKDFVSCDDVRPHIYETASRGPHAGGSVGLSVLEVLCSFASEVSLGVRDCGLYCLDHDEVVVLFDENMFANFKRRRARCSLFPADEAFMSQLLRTQAFSVMVTTLVLRGLRPDSRPPSRTSSPFLPGPSKVLDAIARVASAETPSSPSPPRSLLHSPTQGM